MHHISSNILPFSSQTMLPKEALLSLFKSSGVDLSAPLVATCGSGVTACVVALAVHAAAPSAAPVPIYDGSWTEWALDPSLPAVVDK